MLKYRKRNKIYLIDTSHILYVVYYGFPESDRTVNNLLNGFYKRVLQVCVENHTTNLMFFWDSPTSIRKDRYSFYKAKRKKKHKEDRMLKNIHKAKDILKLALPTSGFTSSIEVDGYEADDTMCYIIKKHPHSDFYIIANDNDLFQILRYKNLKGIFDCRSNTWFTYIDFVNRYGIYPRDWHLYKALNGCTADEIPGIPTIGDKRARQFLRGEATSSVVQVISHHLKTFIRNIWLVQLPMKGLESKWDVSMPDNTVTRKSLYNTYKAFDIIACNYKIVKDWNLVCKRK